MILVLSRKLWSVLATIATCFWIFLKYSGTTFQISLSLYLFEYSRYALTHLRRIIGNSRFSFSSSWGSASRTCLAKFHGRIRRSTEPELSFQLGTSLPPRTPGTFHSMETAVLFFTATETSSPDTID